MTNINSVTIVGRLTKDAEKKEFGSGSVLVRFNLAFNTTKKDGDQYVDEGNFIDCTMWGNRADALMKFLKKGKQVAVQGLLKQKRWETDSGEKRSTFVIEIANIQLVSSEAKESTSEESSEPTKKPQQKTDGLKGPEKFEDDDIPF